jgi:hypothetical protein
LTLPQAIHLKKQKQRLWVSYPAEKKQKGYRRESRAEDILISIQDLDGEEPKFYTIPNSLGLVITAVATPIQEAEQLGLKAGSQSVSIFIANHRKPTGRYVYKSCAFQVHLEVTSSIPFLNQPDLRGLSNAENQDLDERLNDLRYRDVSDFAVGHGVSTKSIVNASGECIKVGITWIPQHEVELVSPSQIDGVEFRMSALGNSSSAEDLAESLQPLVDKYRSWITEQEQSLNGLGAARKDTALMALAIAKASADRIEEGIKGLVVDRVAYQAFQIANRAMSRAAKQRQQHIPDPVWRPFQLAFILQNLSGIIDPNKADREIVDLLFFPTGGGKTEAYLGLAAITLVLRRLRNPGISYAGVSVMMRYTLRLLTLDQLGRAAGLVCALELERSENDALGKWPFEIGLWVGSAATPNRMGGQGYRGPGAEYTAYKKFVAYQSDSKHSPSPIPLEKCQWCDIKFDRNSFKLTPNQREPDNLEVRCANRDCAFSREKALPILAVDEPIYRRLPCFLIATVDKFAALPWEGRSGALLGHVDRYDAKGFYGAFENQPSGIKLTDKLPGPDLIIQDELHLISGPLGTIAGVYETAIEKLASRVVGGKEIKPKIVASTATVRRAKEQIQALFGRSSSSIFPPQGPDIKDSFFAETNPIDKSNGRLYIGVAAQGRSLKVILMRTALAILCASEKLYKENGGKDNKKNPLDPYMTLMGYFNSLRELGGSRRIIEDEVVSRAMKYASRRRLEPKEGSFYDRKLAYEPRELTSRVTTNEVAETKRLLEMAFSSDPEDGRPVDVALATNMISVGLDITRLGLMMVIGQPKGTAEYIQATSRVGRDKDKPGLVISLLNVHKPRDRSHYEHFSLFHKTFYRSVEASSVTPFSPRALDRALAASVVAVARHSIKELTPALGANEINKVRSELDQVAKLFSDRCLAHKENSEENASKIRARCRDLLDTWLKLQHRANSAGLNLQYQEEMRQGANSVRLLHDFLSHDLPEPQADFHKFRANRSMRDVEAAVKISVKKINE